VSDAPNIGITEFHHRREIEAIEAWLDSKHTTLWGRGYDIIQSDSKRAAAEWMRKEIQSLMDFMDQGADSQ
jgi:hypothetical protein